MTLAGAGALTPHLDWHQYLANLGLPSSPGSTSACRASWRRSTGSSRARRSRYWKTYLRWQLLDAYAPYLSKRFVDEDFRMVSALNGAQELQPRWLRVLHAEDEALGFAIGQLYVAQKFPQRRAATRRSTWWRTSAMRCAGTSTRSPG